MQTQSDSASGPAPAADQPRSAGPRITLLSHTPNAAALLVLTKSARLGLSPERFSALIATPLAQLKDELAYMADTIPSSWEFVDYVFLVEGVSRAYTHQQVRTRTGSYAQQSLRVVNRSDFGYVWPRRALPAGARAAIERALVGVKVAYAEAIDAGAAVEDARGILPTNIATNIVCKFNLRTLAELAASRLGGRTQSEYVEVVAGFCDAVLHVHPWAEAFLFPQKRDFFGDIEAFAEKTFGGDLLRKGELLKIVDKMRKARGAL